MTEPENELDELVGEPEPPLSPDEVAGEAEAEEAEEAAQEPADEPAEAPEARSTTPEEWEKRWKGVERAFATYTRKVTDLWGDDAPRLVPFNVDPYSPPGFLNPEHAGRLDEDTKAAAMEFLGFPREQEYEADPYAQECPTCKGKTLTATGSKSNEYRTRVCPDCKGYGYKDVRDGQANGGAPTTGALEGTAPDIAPLVSGETDSWGEPRILPNGERNENYGLMPQYKRPHPKYGITSQLSQTPAG